jgi:large subunit ribosomal protein L21
MMVLDGADVTVGNPLVAGATLTARIEQHGRAPKLRFMKYKNKVRYRRILGHRQPVTRLVVQSITKG